MILTAITGSIGCGKTTLANILREQGYLVYDIDKWVKYLYFDKRFLSIIQKFFPETFENNVFNKRKLRTIVFDNPMKLKELENLIHPFLGKKLRHIIRTSKNNGIVFVDVALLYEMNWNKYFNYVILADVDEKIQKERVIKRDNISEEDFYKINKLQMPMAEKRKKVDFIINTGVNINELRRELFYVIERIDGNE